MFTAAFVAVAFMTSPRLDADGFALPPEALRRFGSARFCTDPPRSVAYSPDGKAVYLVRAGGSVWPGETVPAVTAWEVATGRRLWEYHAELFRGLQVAADPDKSAAGTS
jgi:hypothetical protein